MLSLKLLKEEIAAKKRSLEESNLVEGEKKFFKRGDLVAQQTEAYWERCGNRPGSSAPGQQVSDGNGGDGNASSAQDTVNDEDDAPELPRQEVVRRLREREEPVLLYGESEHDAFRRLRRLEILEPEVNRGLRNDFQEALERVDQAYLNEILKTEGGEAARNVALTGENITMASVIEMAKDLQGTAATNELRCKVIMKFAQLILQMWGSRHNARPEGEKMSVRGKMDSATYNQTQAYLRPLFKCLRKRSLPDDIMECLIEIVQHCLDRDYVKANDAYLQMAIGNAPWPIGVTMVGIHARTGREKIFSKHVAHVLNDETQRKYIQGLKRLMTKCQQYFSADPSKCVEYKALAQ
ncbi:pre-mRNA-splicing factor 18-like [Portunus trituberculatus]|uniref:Pre-mRNA-splicing factor 18 n=1 Tax=Portunus trituberculatus TaxID=210409 RepID=A0A5B7IBX9_PORTR|nr:pre-mRNA-splicing factor 18-like [Portunus trituberculatus]XP_045121897.1 pre-mRNA-splicing factor 18-like [Portunus trituberculatus]MPC79416.1 Pre-mRNA-splicing factor 18 [Portunus trituberculatus]